MANVSVSVAQEGPGWTGESERLCVITQVQVVFFFITAGIKDH
jgi:hypothetical protein